MTNIAIENDHLYWNFPLKMVIFYSYVSLPEGNMLRFFLLFEVVISGFFTHAEVPIYKCGGFRRAWRVATHAILLPKPG